MNPDPSPLPTASAPGPGGMTLRWKMLTGAGFLVAAVLLGREFGHLMPVLRAWAASQGALGWVLFVVAVMVFTSVFVPDTVFAVTAGMLYGVAGGTALVTVAVFLTASMNFLVARRWLSGTVRRWLDRQPRMAAIERAIHREGFRFQLLLRLTPLSPVALSYALGTTPTRFGTFIAACVGLIPGLFVEVYLGHVAQSVAQVAHAPSHHSPAHTVFTVGSLAACLAVFAYITRIARRALAGQESDLSEAAL